MNKVSNLEIITRLILLLNILIYALLSSAWASDELNVYSARKGYLLEPLIEAFEKESNIKVNVVSGKAKALQKRITEEGAD